MSKYIETQETNDVLKTNTTEPNISADDDVIELGDNFDFDGFQVVRREFFAHIREPSISFNSCKFQ